MEEIVNRVANSPLKSVDLEDYIHKGRFVHFDIKDLLFQEMILREKDFRAFVKDHEWEKYRDCNVYINCSVDAIIPSWAFMLLMSRLQPIANEAVVGDESDLEKVLVDQAIEQVLNDEMANQKVIIKGCGNIKNREYAYGQFAKKLVPVVASLMYGEPCSTVPVYKKPRK